MEYEKEIKHIKRISLIVMVTLFISVISFALIYKKNQGDLFTKDLKISSLITEVGGLKEQNEKLLQYMEEETATFDGLYQQITGETENLSKTKKSLIEVLAHRESIIKELTQKNSNLKQALNFADDEEKMLNILVLGTHKKLTDTIMVASVNPVTKKITLVSIPRDLYYNGRKINELYEFYGAVEAAKAVSDITSLAIDRYLVVDMKAFVNAIDLVEGVDINIEKELYDNMYPGANYTYRTVVFHKGLEHMDGERALEYARTRKTTSDFDRSKRQQQVLQALKTKLKEQHYLDDLTAALKLYDAVKDTIETDINAIEALGFVEAYKDYDIRTGNSINTGNYLYSSVSTSGQYILLPNKKGFSEIQEYVTKLVTT